MSQSGDAGRPARRISNPWFWALLGIAPFLLVYLFPIWNAPADQVATGFIQYDQASYVAHGRAAFERGAGWLAPNPYDPSPDAPCIYFHGLNWLLGLIVVGSGLDPGTIYVVLGLIMALLFGRLTVALVERCCEGRGRAGPVFLLTMWGGGIAVLGAMVANAVEGRPVLDDPLRLEPFRGWWFLYWGRNLVFTTEATYHVLMASAWLTLITRRWALCLLAVALTLAIHPYTGLQLAAIVVPWSYLNLLRPGWTGQDRAPWWFALGLSAATAVFLAYYTLFLPSFAEHRSIQESWSRDWSETPLETLLAYLPVALLALVRLARERPWSRPHTTLLVCAVVVSFGLSHHHWLTSPHMPLHFTRGYVWMPLALLAAPRLAELAAGRRANRRRRVVLAGLALLFCVDNAAWLWATSSDERRPLMIHTDLRALYREMDRERLRGVVLADNRLANYLTATYTGCRVYQGHVHLTPDRKRRARRVKGLLRALDEAQESGVPLSSKDIGAWFDEIDYLLWRRGRAVPAGWSPVLQTAEYVLYGGPGAAPADQSR